MGDGLKRAFAATRATRKRKERPTVSVNAAFFASLKATSERTGVPMCGIVEDSIQEVFDMLVDDQVLFVARVRAAMSVSRTNARGVR